MDHDYRPESPDLSSLDTRLHSAFSSGGGGLTSYQHPISIPQQQFDAVPPRQMQMEDEDDDYVPTARPAKRGRKPKQVPTPMLNGTALAFVGPSNHIKAGDDHNPTLGCSLHTSFPVARIKRIMQADEDIGKVAQVTPTVVSRALELFMIKLISAAAHQARGGMQAGAAGASKGPRRVLAQHLKRAVLAEEKFDFLNEIVDKVPDAPTKAKKETAGSDSEDAKPKRKGRKRKDSGDEL